MKKLLNYKKPKFWTVFLTLIMATTVCLGLITNTQTFSLPKVDSENFNATQIMVPTESKSFPAFSEAEVAAARSVVEEYFRAVAAKDDKGILKTLTPIKNSPNTVLYGDERRTLLSIDYNENDLMRKSYVENGR